MLLTDNQRAAVVHDDNALVVACPGSGKTRAIVAKLLRCVRSVRETARKIGCITYTNAAVHEIEHRLRIFGAPGDEDYCEISTIHAFCLNNILRFFSWRRKDFKEGFEILAPDSERFAEIVDEIRNKYNLDARAREAFQQLNLEPDGTPIVTDPLTTEIALAFWKRQREERFIDFPNIVYHSYQILKDWPSTARALGCKFPWLLVDEFQDTTALQTAIFRLVAKERQTKFFLVGDPYQSILSFAGARPDLMTAFAKEINARKDFPLSENFRSSANVVEHAERICPRVPQMVAVGNCADCPIEPVHIHAANAFHAITEEFLPRLLGHEIEVGEAAILAPWWVKLFPIGRNLREFGVPVVGPGASPYRRNRLFAPLAENVCAYIESPLPRLIPMIDRQLFFLLSDLTGTSRFGIFSYNGRRTIYKLLRLGKELREQHPGASGWLTAAAQGFTGVLMQDGWIGASCSEKLPQSVVDMHDDMKRNKVDVPNLGVADLGLFACPDRSLKLLSMHGSKGREFEAVAIIDLHEGKVPDFRIVDQEGIEESRRLFYVAATRAKKMLMYVTDSEDWRNRPSRFLGKDGVRMVG